MRLRALQAAANNQNTTAPLTWEALQSMGIPVRYDEFAARWDDPAEGPLLKNLVDKFDGHGLTVKTNEKDRIAKNSHKEKEVSRMAKRATKLGK
jgi:hypothetical protein